jgi:hypothetical protein
MIFVADILEDVLHGDLAECDGILQEVMVFGTDRDLLLGQKLLCCLK